jgi:hypothetical protein
MRGRGGQPAYVVMLCFNSRVFVIAMTVATRGRGMPDDFHLSLYNAHLGVKCLPVGALWPTEMGEEQGIAIEHEEDIFGLFVQARMEVYRLDVEV